MALETNEKQNDQIQLDLDAGLIKEFTKPEDDPREVPGAKNANTTPNNVDKKWKNEYYKTIFNEEFLWGITIDKTPIYADKPYKIDWLAKWSIDATFYVTENQQLNFKNVLVSLTEKDKLQDLSINDKGNFIWEVRKLVTSEWNSNIDPSSDQDAYWEQIEELKNTAINSLNSTQAQ